jgi:hypothetical protein
MKIQYQQNCIRFGSWEKAPKETHEQLILAGFTLHDFEDDDCGWKYCYLYPEQTLLQVKEHNQLKIAMFFVVILLLVNVFKWSDIEYILQLFKNFK